MCHFHMDWDLFTLIQQLLIVVTIAGQAWISFSVILSTTGSERYVRLTSFCTGLLVFLLCRPLHLTFADLVLRMHASDGSLFDSVLMEGAMPMLIGVLVSECTILAMRTRHPVPARFMLTVAAFTLSQAAYTNFVALTTQVTSLDRAFIPNLCYAIAVGMWMTWRYRDDATTRTPAMSSRR